MEKTRETGNVNEYRIAVQDMINNVCDEKIFIIIYSFVKKITDRSEMYI